MIYIRDECELIRNGFNFYPLSNRASRGFVFKLGRFKARLRWSSFRECFFCSVEWRGRALFGTTLPKPRERFKAECDWMLANRIRVERINE